MAEENIRLFNNITTRRRDADDDNDLEPKENDFREHQQDENTQTATGLPDLINERVASTSTSNSNSNRDSGVSTNDENQKQCWVCFATAEDDPDAAWVRPCRCRGSTMWVHQKCLQRWVDEKQRGNTFYTVSCSSCGAAYMIIYPPLNFAMVILEKIDRFVAKLCPLMTGGIIVVALYWTAVTYGAITVMQVMGAERGMDAMERADPMLLLVGLPTIPIMLITVKMIRWEETVVDWLRRYMSSSEENAQRRAENRAPAVGPAPQNVQQPAARDPASATRILCGALALPTIAVVVGKLMYADGMTSPLRRTMYGAALFLAARGIGKIYFKYQQVLRQKRRMIIDYVPNENDTNEIRPPPEARAQRRNENEVANFQP